MADVEGQWYLVSMLGECDWVANVRAAAGAATLRRRRARQVTLVLIPVDQRAAVLKRYVELASRRARARPGTEEH